MIVGYTAGVYDLFHIGHLNLLRNARALCDKLIVGVTVDELVRYKGKQPVIPYVERCEIVRACRYVDVVIPQLDLDKYAAWEKLHYDRLFVGDDWHGDPRWVELERKLGAKGVKVVYFPYTQGTSSTLVTSVLRGRSEDER